MTGTLKWKLRVYNAVIIAQLAYGLETIELTESQKTRLRAFHIKGVRAIMAIRHSYWSRVTNEE